MSNPSSNPIPFGGVSIKRLAQIHESIIQQALICEAAMDLAGHELESAAQQLEDWASMVGKRSCGNPKGKKTPHDATERKAYLSAARMLRRSKWNGENRISDGPDADIPF